MLGVGCWVLGVGCWVLGVGCWVLGVGCWVLGVGCWVLGVGCWAITPEKMEHRLNGRKHIVQLAKDPPPPLLHQKSNGPSLR